MKKSTGVVVIVAVCMVVVGSAIAGGAYLMSGGNIGVTMVNGRMEPINWTERRVANWTGRAGNVITKSESFPVTEAMRIEADIANVELIPVENATEIRVEYSYFEKWGDPICRVNETNTLVYRGALRDQNGWNINNWGGSRVWEDLYVRVYYPQGQVFQSVVVDADMGNLQIKGVKASGIIQLGCDLGAMDVQSLVADRVEIDNAAGESTIRDVNAASMEVEADLGATRLSNIQVSQFSADCDAGELIMEDSTLGHAELNADLGAIRARTISSDSLDVSASSGEVDLEGDLRGITHVQSDLGSVRITTSQPKDSYRMELAVELGSIRVDGQKQKGGSYRTDSGINQLNIQCDLGDIQVSF